MGMQANEWEHTIVTVDEEANDGSSGQGSILQIHPTQIGSGLIRLRDDAFTIGRDAACDLTLSDTAVSRRHAVIERKGQRYLISDRQSTNGTIVNDCRIECHELQAGDRIRIGKFIFKFLDDDCIESQYHETVYQMMTCDGLTGAFNKRFFVESLGREVERSRHHSRPLSLIMFDLDHFKTINDTHGHLAGDEVLQECTRRIKSILHDDQLLARYGGEEFSVILGETGLDRAVELAEACRQVIEAAPFETCAGPVDVTISVGVASFQGKTTYTELIETADTYLYQAKHAGRNQVCSEEIP
ncbi:MAG: diguanylate cyclase [Planctomycetales bacterium]|nr:diguanylate cyclase [Planctomycetales bacterium]